MNKSRDRKIVVINQAVNHLTIGYCNAFVEHYDEVCLITGSIHEQGEPLNTRIKLIWINDWIERPMSRKFISYIIACFRVWWLLITRFRKFEVFFVSVPPMAYLLNLIVRNRFYMLIWDIYPDIFKIYGMSDHHPLYRFWSWLNKKSFAKADLLFTIGDKLKEALTRYVDESKINVVPIWCILQQNEKISPDKNLFFKEHNLQNKFIIQYSGNIGLSHNVEILIKLAAVMRDDDVLFQIIGRGPRMPELEKMVNESGLKNCQFLPFQSDEMFPHSLSAANVGVAILNEDTPSASIPAKSYNLMAFGIPGLYFSADDSQLAINAKKYNNAQCFTKNELDMAREYVVKLKEDKGFYNAIAENALNAAGDYQRNNADILAKICLNKL